MTISAEEIASWHKLYDETQEALQRIGDEFGVLAGEERTSGIRRVLTEQRARIAALDAQLAEAVAALEPFAKEESTWATSVADDYRPGIVEPNQRTAYSKAEFSIGDLRRAAAIRARSEQEGK